MIYIKSRTVKGKLITHRWATVQDMLRAFDAEPIGSEIVQLVIEDDKVLYSSLHHSDPFLGSWLRMSDLMVWFAEEQDAMPWRKEPEGLPVEHEIQPGDFSLEEDSVEWKDMPDGMDSFWLYGLKSNRPLGELLGSQFEHLEPDAKVYISAIVSAGYDMIDSHLSIDVYRPGIGGKEYCRQMNEWEKTILLSMIQKREAERLHNLFRATSSILEGGRA